MNVMQQSELSPIGVKMVSLLGMKWLWCAFSATEITSTVAECGNKKWWEIITHPTFTQNNARVWKLTALANGDYRAEIQVDVISPDRQEIILEAGATLTRFVPKH